MRNEYPLWKYLLVVIVIAASGLYALPNLFDQDPSVLVSSTRRADVDQNRVDAILQAMEREQIAFKASSFKPESKQLLLRFDDSESQLKAREFLEPAYGNDFVVALSLTPDVPGWLTALGAEPMFLGLDLRGGVHILMDVDMEAAVEKAYESRIGDIRQLLREKKIRYRTVKRNAKGLTVVFRDADDYTKGAEAIAEDNRDLLVSEGSVANSLQATITDDALLSIRKFALEQNITTLRNRVNALGVAEPIIQRQGERRIVIQLPGAQDPARIKRVLSATATLEYRLEDTEHSVQSALEGRTPPGSRLYRTREGRPILLKKRIIVTGNQINDAASGFDSQSGSPSVTVSLDGPGANRMRKVTTDNVGKPMAVVFIENRTESKEVDGEVQLIPRKSEEVISVARILEPFGRRFQTTGLDSPEEAHDLALMLRAGALAAPVRVVEERTIGPSLGQDNIDKGFTSVIVGFLVVLLFMIIYYKVFGLFAAVALTTNLMLIVALLSMLQATLTLPGIAGIVLTVGMAVDANVLIYERIREEIRNGSTPQASIYAGYEKAFSTIVDANVTTLIAAVVLFSFGTGPIKGFAVTLFLGILTSMFTAIIGTRALANLVYGRRGRATTKTKLAI